MGDIRLYNMFTCLKLVAFKKYHVAVIHYLVTAAVVLGFALPMRFSGIIDEVGREILFIDKYVW